MLIRKSRESETWLAQPGIVLELGYPGTGLVDLLASCFAGLAYFEGLASTAPTNFEGYADYKLRRLRRLSRLESQASVASLHASFAGDAGLMRGLRRICRLRRFPSLTGIAGFISNRTTTAVAS